MLKDFLAQALAANHFSFSDDLQDQLIAYLELLKKWNTTFNLTAITESEKMIMLHIIDSLSIAPYLSGKTVLDIGSGAGLPGIPLAVMFPEKQFVLLDCNSKKTRFLTQVICELKIKKVEIVHARCEDFHPQTCFDNILSRAFGTLNKMIEVSRHLLCEQGKMLAMKGSIPHEEIQDLPNDFQMVELHKLVLKGLDAERHLLVLKKRNSHG